MNIPQLPFTRDSENKVTLTGCCLLSCGCGNVIARWANIRQNLVTKIPQGKPKSSRIIYDWIELGVLMQQNFGSIIGQYGKKAEIIARKMLETDSVHFLGSDVHRPNSVYKNMPKILEKIQKIIGEDMLEELTVSNPSKVLLNEKININSPDKIKLGFGEKLKMKMK